MSKLKKDISKSDGKNQSSEKLLMLLEFLSGQDEPIRLLDIAKTMKVNISTVSRFLTALQLQGYVTQDLNTGHYCLTYKICRIAENVSSKMNIRQIALPYLHAISKETGCTSNLVARYDMSAMYLEIVQPPSPASDSPHHIGSIAPLHCTGAGKLILTEFDDNMLDELSTVRGLSKYTEFTIDNLNDLKNELKRIAECGYAYDKGECERGTWCFAAPVRNYTDRIVAAISINGPALKITDEFIDAHRPFITEMADKISKHLGFESKSPACMHEL